MTKQELAIGVQVTYQDINLRYYVGDVTAIGRTKNGGDCLVQWHKYPFASEECASNLTLTAQQKEADERAKFQAEEA